MASGSKVNSSALQIEYNHPLYIHDWEAYGVSLVAEKLAGSENYWSWRSAMKTQLLARNKMGIVDGSYPKPDADSPLLGLWGRCDAFVYSWITSSVSETFSNWFIYTDSACAAWKKLETLFHTVNDYRFFNLQQEICSLTQGNGSVSKYCSKLMPLLGEYSSLAFELHPDWETSKEVVEFQKHQDVMHFLKGVNASFTTRNQILSMSPLPSVWKAEAMVEREERLQLMAKKPTDSRGW